MDPQLLALLFLIAGIVLVFLELFVPSGGAIAILCGCCFLASGYYAYQSWYSLHPFYWWLYVAAVAIVIPGSVIGAFQLLIRTPLGNKIILQAPSAEEVTPYLEEQARLQKLIGERGKALTPMTPGGMVLVDNERLHASSEGLMIEADQPVEVVAVRGNRVVVRQIQLNPATQEVPERPPLAESADPFEPWIEESES